MVGERWQGLKGIHCLDDILETDSPAQDDHVGEHSDTARRSFEEIVPSMSWQPAWQPDVIVQRCETAVQTEVIIIIIIQHLYSAIMSYADTEALK